MPTNPCQKFMTDLKHVCKDVDKRVSKLEREMQPSTLSKRPKDEYCEASQQLLSEAKELVGQIKSSTEEVKEQRADLSSFLDEWQVQFGNIIAETMKMEDFMAQYGFQPDRPFVAEEWDWNNVPVDEEEETSTTPAAGSEFPNEEEGDYPPPPENKFDDPPSVFDIGLSTAAMEIVVGRSLRKLEPETQEHIPESCAEFLPCDPTPASPVIVMTKPSQQSLMEDESLYAASPFLRCQSKLSTQMSDSSMSGVDNDLSNLELTPGLLTRKVPSSLQKLSTPIPSPQLRMNTHVGLKEDLNVTAAVPFLQSKDLISKANQSHTDSPKLPDLQTVDLRRLIHNIQSTGKFKAGGGNQEKSSTPEEPTLSSFSSVKEQSKTTTPEMPEVRTLCTAEVSKTPEPPVLHFKY